MRNGTYEVETLHRYLRRRSHTLVPSDKFMDHTITFLKKEFEVTDLGNVH